MKQALLYEWKRILLPLCVITAIATVLFTAATLSADFVWSTTTYDPELDQLVEIGTRPGNPLLNIPATILGVLCTLVPAMQYAYRMKKRSVDLWYSLPVTRTKLMLVRTLGGFALVFIPYTVSYWAGFIVTACSENLFYMVWYVPLFFASIPVGLALYGLNAFLFTRANTVGDGILFMLAWSPALIVAVLYFDNYFRLPDYLENLLHFCSYGPINELFIIFPEAVRTGVPEVAASDAAFLFTLWGVLGAAAYFGLFFTAKGHPAENAGRISDSWFGYRVLIPFYLFFLALNVVGSSFLPSGIIDIAVLFVAGLVAYIVYRRSFRLKLADVLSIVLSIGAGCLLAIATLLIALSALS